MMAESMVDVIYPQSDASQTERIVDYLIEALRIPHGDHLVAFFGSGTEQSNREAMITWVRGLGHEYEADEAEYRLARLVLHSQLAASNDMEGAS